LATGFLFRIPKFPTIHAKKKKTQLNPFMHLGENEQENGQKSWQQAIFWKISLVFVKLPILITGPS